MSNRDNNISVRESLIEREKEIVRVKLVSERERKKVGANFEKESRGKERAAKLLIPLSLTHSYPLLLLSAPTESVPIQLCVILLGHFLGSKTILKIRIRGHLGASCLCFEATFSVKAIGCIKLTKIKLKKLLDSAQLWIYMSNVAMSKMIRKSFLWKTSLI